VATVREFVTRRRQIPRVLKRVVIALATGAAALIAVGWVVSSILAARAIRQAEHLLDLSPPTRMIVCRVGPTPPCLAEASRRMGMPTAWMVAPPGYRFRWLAAAGLPNIRVDRRLAFEDLTSDRVSLELSTQPFRPTWDMRLVGTYTVGGTVVQVFVPDDPVSRVLTLLWTRKGRPYSLDVTPEHILDSSPLNPKEFLPLVRTVRYAGTDG
jgi:hypothetical protein